MATTPTQIRIDPNIKMPDAMAEARKISRDPDIKGYSSLEELKAALEEDV